MADALLPVSADGTMLPATALLRWMERTHHAGIRALALPTNSASLPDLLALAGISQIEIPGIAPCRWLGAGGAAISMSKAVLGDAASSDPGPMGSHQPELRGTLDGPAPPTSHTVGVQRQITAGVETAARVADAHAVFDGNSVQGAPWDEILAHLSQAAPPPPLGQVFAGTGMGAWNPLPFARRALVMLPLPDAPPAALLDANGARHPAQIVSGPSGVAHGMLADVELGALAATTLAPTDEPAPGATWEVSERVLDNGRVRAEFDVRGRIARLSWDGVFAEWTGPAVTPLIDGQAFGSDGTDASGTSATVVTVWERGPVRALVTVTRSGPSGTLELSYALHAHEDALRISAHYDGTGLLELDHPTAHADASLVAIDELREYTLASIPGASGPRGERRGLRWASLGDRAGRGVAIAAGEPFPVRVEHGHLLLPVEPRIGYALMRASRPSGPWRAAAGLAVPHLAHAGAARAARFRLVAPPHVATAWLRPCPGWQAELLLADQAATRSRVFLYPTRVAGSGASEAVKVDAFGATRSAVRATPENDGFQIELSPGEIALVRWR